MTEDKTNLTSDGVMAGQLQAARQALQAGDARTAARQAAEVLQRQPGQAEALMLLAQIALVSGDRSQAAALLEKTIEANPRLAEPWYRLGVLRWSDQASEAAGECFAKAVHLDPDHAQGWMKLGVARLALGEQLAAAEAFQQSILLEPRLREADKFQSLPRSVRDEVRQARQVLRNHYREMAEQTLARTRARFPGADLERFETAFKILRGEAEKRYCHPMQQPVFLLFPDMPARPWFEREEFDWVEHVEAATPKIRAELDALLADRAGFQPYIRGIAPGKDAISYANEDFSTLANSQAWNSFHLNNAGVIPEHAARCPETMAVLDDIPLAQARDYMPEIFFSVLQPGAHIIPHFGQMNIRLTVHLGLIIPEGCGLRAGDETRHWEEGRLLLFDDSFEHEAWNRGNSDRVVLIFETWNPDLSEAEIVGLQDFFETRADWMSRFRKPRKADA